MVISDARRVGSREEAGIECTDDGRKECTGAELLLAEGEWDG